MANSSSNGLLKVIFILHLMLSAWGMESAFTVPTSYLYTNLIFMMVLLWAIVNQTSADATGMAFLVSATIFAIDIITLSVYWPRGERHRLYLGFAVTNTILRPVTCLILYRIFTEADLEGSGMRGVLGQVLDGPTGMWNSFNNRNREYRGTAGGSAIPVPPPPGTHRMSYEPIDPAKP